MLIGLVGKPSAGKSTFFKAATLAEAEIANYPFTTIKPNHGIGYVKTECADKFFNTKCNPREGFCIGNNRFVPIDMIDVAGLVPGAHEGKGMGSQFLDDLRQADVLIHVVDISGSINEKGEQVEALSYDPANDMKFLEEELDFWILKLVKKGWERFSKTVQQSHLEPNKAVSQHLSGLGIKESDAEEVINSLSLPENITQWSDNDFLMIARKIRKKSKPIIIACNKIDIPGADRNFDRLKEAFPDYTFIKCSSESELALREAAKHGLIDYIPGEKSFSVKDSASLSPKQAAALEFIRANVLEKHGSTGIQDTINHAVFSILKCIAIFPGGMSKLADQFGRILPDFFLLPGGSTALDFAYKIHTDLGKKFIRAIDVKKRLTVGKEYKLQNGDVIEIVADK